MNYIDKTVKEIKELKIQGATEIARASLKALIEDIKRLKYQDVEELRREAEKLKKVRPTEPLTVNCLYYVFNQGKILNDLNHLKKKVEKMLLKIERGEKEIAKNGASLIRDGMYVLTHCHSSQVVKIFENAKKRGVTFRVFLTETRPLYQGRITAKELLRMGIETTMVVDSAASYLVSDRDEIPIDLVLLGCDAIFPSGGVFNKIGSYGIALAAWQAKTPLFIVGSLLKTTTSSVEIEKRKGKEIWEKKPKGLEILNLAFDFIPNQFINGLVCEFGITKPKKVREVAEKNYPWIFKF